MSGKILVVDDEKSIRELLRYNLTKEGYTVIEAEDGIKAVAAAKREHPNLLLLDLMLPGMDGMTVCRTLRATPEFAGVPIIMLTAKVDEIDKVIGLEMGADDYITKPFSTRELIARIKAVLRRSAQPQNREGELTIGKLRLNFQTYEVFLCEDKLELTPKEFELLKLLATNAGRVLTREQLLEKIWGYEYFGDTRTVDVHVRHLRAKFEIDPECAELIETVRGIGYRLRNY